MLHTLNNQFTCSTVIPCGSPKKESSLSYARMNSSSRTLSLLEVIFVVVLKSTSTQKIKTNNDDARRPLQTLGPSGDTANQSIRQTHYSSTLQLFFYSSSQGGTSLSPPNSLLSSALGKSSVVRRLSRLTKLLGPSKTPPSPLVPPPWVV